MYLSEGEVGTKAPGASGSAGRCYFHIKRINVVRDLPVPVEICVVYIRREDKITTAGDTQIYVGPAPRRHGCSFA